MSTIPDSTWRSHPFVVGRLYEALETFHSFPRGEFSSGQLYELQHVGYSRYDSSTVFAFRGRDGAELVNWWWHDEEPIELCTRRFRQHT